MPAANASGLLIRHSAGFALSLYVARVVMLARGWAAAAALGPHGYGLWNTLNLIFDYGSYASVGAVQGLDLELPAAHARGERARAHSLMRGAWSVVLVGAVAFSVGLALLMIFGPHPVDAPPAGLAMLMLLAAILQLAFQYHAAALRAAARVPAVSAAQAVQAVAGAGLGLALVWRYGLLGLLVGWIAGTLLSLALMRRDGPDIPLVPGEWRAGLALARLGLPVFAFYVASLVLRSVDRLALVQHGRAESLGLYSVGLMAAGSLLHLPESAGFVLLPQVAAAHRGAADPHAIRRLVRQTQRVMVALMPLVVGLVMLWTGPVIAWALPDYSGGVRAIQMLCIAALVMSTATIPSYYLLGSGAQKQVLAIGVLAAAAAAVIVFRTASVHPDPLEVAKAATLGYGLFAVPVLVFASTRLCAGFAARAGFVALSLLPPAALSGLALVLLHVAPGTGALRSLIASGLFLAVAVPTAWLVARGIGKTRRPS